MQVEIKRIHPLRVAFIRHVGPYSRVGATWDKLLPLLGKEGALGGNPMFIGVCHDDPEVTAPARLRYDACVTVDEDLRGEGEIGLAIIAGGEYAVTTHPGPYNKLGDTYAALLGQWLPRSRRELASTPCFEVYLNSPENTPAEDLLTDIYGPCVKSQLSHVEVNDATVENRSLQTAQGRVRCHAKAGACEDRQRALSGH